MGDTPEALWERRVPWRDRWETGAERLEQSWRKTLSVSGFHRPDLAGSETLGTALGHVGRDVPSRKARGSRSERSRAEHGAVGGALGGEGREQGEGNSSGESSRRNDTNRATDQVSECREVQPLARGRSAGRGPAQLRALGWVSGEGSSPLGVYR